MSVILLLPPGRMLLHGGELNGARILEESTAKMIMSDQLPVLINYKEGMGYGLSGQVDLVKRSVIKD